MNKTRLLLSLGATMSFAAFGFQQPEAPPGKNSSSSQTTTKKGKTSTTSDSAKTTPASDSADTSSRSRVNDASGSMLTPEDQKFMMNAAKGGMMEVQMGQAAQQKASSQAVKDFGKRMETDHGQVSKELEGIAKARNISLPSDMGSEKSMMDKLSNRSGDAYDKTYMRMMISDHKKDIKEFEREVNIGVDSDLKAFATKNLPTLKEHLRIAEETSRNLKHGGSTSATTTTPAAKDTAATPGTEKNRMSPKTRNNSKTPADNSAAPAPPNNPVPPSAVDTDKPDKTPK